MDTQKTAELLKRITFNTEIFNGKPVIREMRFKVSDVLELFANGLSHEQILEEHPMLEAEDLAACLLYATMIVSDSKSAELHAA
jgi:uncharacterized protein (DUF433 family)